jgi:hypothetical protein
MSLDVFKACAQGYSDRLFDLQVLGVQEGYWAGYYGRAKKPKSFSSIVKTLMKSRQKKADMPRQHQADVDVDVFKQMEESFQARWKQLNS